MTSFSASTTADAVVPVERARVWEVLTDPDLVAKLTPFVKSIEADGDEHWIWSMSGVKVAGTGFSATFTEKMTLTDGERIEFRHDPPSGGGATERAGVHGYYELADADPKDVTDGSAAGAKAATRLRTSLEICVELPLPKLSAPAVRTAMKGVMATMGARFARNLLHHLDAS